MLFGTPLVPSGMSYVPKLSSKYKVNRIKMPSQPKKATYRFHETKMSSHDSGEFLSPDKMSRNPQTLDLDIFQEFSSFQNCNIDGCELDQKDVIFEFLSDLYIDMHSETILNSNKDIYKNVNMNERHEVINKQRDENFNINMAGFLEMIEVIDDSPFEFSFADGSYSKNEEHPRMNSLRIKDTSKSG